MTIVLTVELPGAAADADPGGFTRGYVAALLRQHGLEVERVQPAHVSHAITMAAELALPDTPEPDLEPVVEPDPPAEPVVPREPAPEPPTVPRQVEPVTTRARRQRRRGPAAALVEGRDGKAPVSERPVPSSTRFTAPPLRSPRAEGLDPPDLERVREQAGDGLGGGGIMSPFAD